MVVVAIVGSSNDSERRTLTLDYFDEGETEHNMIDDPLLNYHTLLRRSLPAGGTNVQYEQPNPYAMSLASSPFNKQRFSGGVRQINGNIFHRQKRSNQVYPLKQKLGTTSGSGTASGNQNLNLFHRQMRNQQSYPLNAHIGQRNFPQLRR